MKKQTDEFEEAYQQGFNHGKQEKEKEILGELKEMLLEIINWNDKKYTIEDKYVLFSGDVQDEIRERIKKIKELE